MTIHKIRNAYVILQSINSTPAERRLKIGALVRDNLNSQNSRSTLDLNYWGHIQARRNENQSVGHALAELIKSGDWDTAQDLLNDNQRVRDRWTSSGHHNPLDEMFNEWFSHAPEVFVCEDCGYLEQSDNGHWAYDDVHICGVCCDDNYTYSDNQCTYISNEDWEEEQEREQEEEEDDSVIGDYHSSKRRLERIPSSFDTRKTRVLMGLELEMEVRSVIGKITLWLFSMLSEFTRVIATLVWNTMALSIMALRWSRAGLVSMSIENSSRGSHNP